MCAGEAPFNSGADDTELEEELLLSEAELDEDSVSEINDLPEASHREKLPSPRSDASKPRPGEPVEDSVKEEKVQKDTESADSLEKAFAKLELELV